jgi:hypothetical protein
MYQSIIKSPRSIRSPKWSGFFIRVGVGSTGFGISLGGSGALLLTVRTRLAPAANGLAEEEKDGERLVRSLSASDQLKPSPVYGLVHYAGTAAQSIK